MMSFLRWVRSCFNVEGPITDNTGHYVARLRVQFLTPIITTLTFAVLVIILTIYYHEDRAIDRDVIQLQSTSIKIYQGSMQQNATALHSVLDALKTNPEISEALANKDRHRLLQLTEPIYSDLNRDYGITHFYFSGADRVNLLRVHKPEKYGDTINRYTTITAEKGGVDSYGVELGPLGTLTLRYVQPWYGKNTQKLLGYVELGMELDQTFESMRDLFSLDIFLLIKKDNLNQQGWEEGMRTFGRVPDWQQYTQIVLSLYGGQTVPKSLATSIEKIDFSTIHSAFKIRLDSRDQHAIFQPFSDVSGRIIGMMVMSVDTSSLSIEAHHRVIIAATIIVFAAIILSLFFYWFVGRIGQRMANDELKLQKMATHDGLTGLLNRRKFDLLLQELVNRQIRYGRPFSMLMLDIDHFKHVNDTYGHQAGDVILTELGNRLKSYSRETDSAARYGGEEFTLLMPETVNLHASEFAQRLCENLASEPWDIGNGTKISVTLSIGVATCPEHANTPQELIAAADKALYIAKETGRNRIFNYQDILDKENTAK